MNDKTILRRGLSLGMMFLAAASASAVAQDTPNTNSSDISLDFGVDLTTEYFFRGYLQENAGVITQPWLELGFSLIEAETDDDFSLDATLGVWDSFHSKHTAASGVGQRTWYESDIYGGFSLGWDIYSLGLSYTFYTYPSNTTFPTVQELGITLDIDLPDDHWSGEWLGDLSLGLYVETDNSNVFTDEASYFEIGLSGPSFDLPFADGTLSVPATLGLSVDNYYVGTSDETFGFFSIGAVAEFPLWDNTFGNATLTAGITALFLGDTAQAANNGDDSAFTASVGISISY